VFQPRPDRSTELRTSIVELAQRHRRYAVGMIYLKLRQRGECVNYKRVERLYRLEKLQVQRRKGKKRDLTERYPLGRPSRLNEVWSIDFVFDRAARGRTLKCLIDVD
jgi:transposase InsO family protein